MTLDLLTELQEKQLKLQELKDLKSQRLKEFSNKVKTNEISPLVILDNLKDSKE